MGYMRYLGIDYGTKKAGLALSDEAGTMGFPKEVVSNDARLLDTVCAVIAREGVGAVVIGESKDFSGRENPVALAARAFGTALADTSGVPVFYEAETLTTQEARRGMDGMHPNALTTRARKVPRAPQSQVDASAAALILTSYLSRRHD